MKQSNGAPNNHTIMDCLSHLPRKMLALHGKENMPEFVLHELCHENCFNFNKAAYFIDNPDFNCCKGIVGFSRAESYVNNGNIWEFPDAFTAHMQSSPFNQKVRQWSYCSLKKTPVNEEELVAKVASDLNLKDPHFCTWNMKHDNHGILIYEKTNPDDGIANEQIMNGVCLLGFCPIF
jgi:hypothetical protein